MRFIDTFVESLYDGSSGPEIVKIFLDKLSEIAETDDEVAFYYDSIAMKMDEFLMLIEEAEDNVNLWIQEMENISQALKNKFKQNGLNYFSINIRRKALCSLIFKINRNIQLGKSIESIKDLLGMEIIINTPTEFDTEQSIADLRKAVQLTFEYFTNSNEHKGNHFSLCDTSELKNAISPEHLQEEVDELIALNPRIFLPAEPLIEEKFRNFGKDYAFQPKITTAYQGVQFVVKSKGIYFEIQLKTQPMREYLDIEDSPGNHKKHKKGQKKKTVSDCVQFSTDYDPEKIQHIYGFRNNPAKDKSGILAPIKWSLHQSTHEN